MCVTCGCGIPDTDHGDSRNITLTDLVSAARAASLDLDEVVANISSAVAVNKSLPDAACRVVKADGERRYTLGLAYPANRPDVGVAQDGHRDFVSAEVLEEAAWGYLTKGGSVGLHHQNGTEGHGRVVESYIWRGPAWHLTASDGSDVVIKAGDWLLGTVWDEPTWEAIKAGEFNGYSPQGHARRRAPTPEALASLRTR